MGVREEADDFEHSKPLPSYHFLASTGRMHWRHSDIRKFIPCIVLWSVCQTSGDTILISGLGEKLCIMSPESQQRGFGLPSLLA